MVRITDELEIDDGELTYSASRSSGPGGQNVNKLNTRVTLSFDVDASEALTDEQKARLRERLASRINKEGVLRVSSQRERSQLRNQQAACERFTELVRDALEEEPERRPTKVPKRARRRRLENKRRRSEVKRRRARPTPGDERY